MNGKLLEKLLLSKLLNGGRVMINRDVTCFQIFMSVWPSFFVVFAPKMIESIGNCSRRHRESNPDPKLAVIGQVFVGREERHCENGRK